MSQFSSKYPFPQRYQYSSENFRGPMYSGTARKGFSLRDKHGNVTEVPRLYDQCLQASFACRKFVVIYFAQVLKDNVDSIDETGNLPFDILKPVRIILAMH